MISVGILSHYAPKTLHHTLQTYKTAGMFDMTDDIFVVIQNSSRQDEEKKVCDSFEVRAICLPDNGKMAWGFKTIYEQAKYDHILFLENDFIINTSKEDTIRFFHNCIYFLTEMNADIVRGRSRKSPGQPNYAMHLSRRPAAQIANDTHLSECIYWLEDPEKVYTEQIKRITPKIEGDKWYVSSSKYCNYTNNPYACSKEFFKNAILPYISFGKTIETELTQSWSHQHYRCVFGPGLFTHNRLFDGHR